MKGYSINCSNYKGDKLEFDEEHLYKMFNGTYFRIYPRYQYKQRIKQENKLVMDKFLFTTEFIKIKTIPFKYGPKFFISSHDSMALLELIKSYETKAIEYLESNYENIKSINTILRRGEGNNEDYFALNLLIKNGKILTEIINYNISKKYPSKETFTKMFDISETYNKLKRFIRKGKYIRFVIEPHTWIRKCEDGIEAGNILKIKKMIVKYENQEIDCDLNGRMNEIESVKI